MLTRTLRVVGVLLLTASVVWGQSLTRTLPSVNPSPNGTVDIGVSEEDFRMLTNLKFDPGAMRLTRIGETQPARVFVTLNDGSAYDVTSPVFGTTYSISPSTVASVNSAGVVTALGDGPAFLSVGFRGITGIVLVQVDTSNGVRSLDVQPAAVTFDQVGSGAQLSVAAAYADSSTSDVTLKSSTTYVSQNPSVAVVAPSGRITAVGSGQTTVRVEHGSFAVDVDVSVSIPSDKEIVSISATPAQRTLRGVGSTLQISVSALQSGGGVMDVTSRLTGTSYESSSSSVATVSADGTVSAIADGKAVVTASNSGFSYSVQITVSLAPLQTLIVTPSSETIPLNGFTPVADRQLTVTGAYSDGSVDDFTSRAAGTRYTSSNAGVATVGTSGLVTFTQAGNVTITASTGTRSSSTQFTVTRFRPTPLGIISGVFTNVAAQGQTAYLTAGTGGFRTVDASNPSSPSLAGTLSTSGSMLDVKISGSRAFVAETSGLAVIDVSNIASPSRTSTISGTSVIAVAADAGRVYYTDGTTLKIIDASTLSLLGQLPGLAAGAQGLSASGGLAFVAMGGAGLAVVDVSVASAPVLAATVNVPGGAFNVASRGRAAFVPGTGSPRSVHSIDASIPSAAALVGQTNITMNANGVAVSGSLMVVAENVFVNSMPIFNVSDPANPAYLGTVDFPGDGEGFRAALAGNLSFLINASGPNPGLYIGIVAPATTPVPPTVSLLSPAAGTKVVEGAFVSVLANASSNIGVANVAFSVNGVIQSTNASGPYSASVRIPMGTVGTPVVVSAQAQDFGGLLSAVSSVTVTVTPDPLTTVQGRLTDVFGNPIANAPIRLLPGLQTTSAADGSFLVTHVPTSQGTIPLSSTATVSGFTLFANVQKPPVLSGITNFGTIVLNGNVTLSGAVSGTLVPILSPYKITGSAAVNTGQTLSVPAGTILKFAPAASLSVNGTLTASGTSGSPVIFTSLADDANGGDTGGDGPTIGAPGQYTGLIFANANAATNLSFSRFLYGQSVQVTNGLATFNDGLFASMSVAAIRMSPGARVAGANNQATGNPVNAVDVVTGDMSTPGNSWTSIGLPYAIRGGGVNLRQNMSISAGVIVKLQGGSLSGQEGALTVNGTAAQPVIFTSFKDDVFGGDTNGDASLTNPAPGDWITLSLSGNSPNSLNNLVVRYGGGANNSMVSVNNVSTIANIELSSSALYGMLVQNALTLTSATVSANATTGGIYMINGASATLTDVAFVGNKADGLRLDGNAKATVYNSSYMGNLGYGVFANNTSAGSYLNMSTSVFNGNAGVIKLAPAIGSFNLSGPVAITNSGIAGIDVLTDPNLGGIARTWTNPGIPYVLRGGPVSLRQNLSINAGVIVKLLGNSSITGQEGALFVNGTPSQPVVFTSLKDDEFGGDTNVDGAATAPAPGDWVTIGLSGNSPNSLNNVVARYGGGANNAMIAVNNPSTIANLDLSSSALYGMLVQNTLTLTSATISANVNTAGIYMINGASATLTNVAFLRNKADGLRLDGNARAFVYNSAYASNAGYGVFANNPNNTNYLVMSTASFNGNAGVIKLAPAIGAFNLTGPVSITNSGIAGIDVQTDPNLGGVARTWTNPGIPYVLRSGPVSLRQNLSINPGVIVKLLGSNSSITGQEGALFVNGTPTQPVVFTSLKDDEFGGDTNVDGTATAPAPGDWVTIGLGGNSPNSLNNVVARYGGGANNAMVAVNNPSTITNLDISSSALYGMLVQNTLTLTSATVSANAVTAGIYMINGASATLTNVSFLRNKADGLRLDGNARAFVYNSSYEGNAGYGVFANNPNNTNYLVMSTASFNGNAGVIKLAPAIGSFNLSGPVSISNSGIAGIDVQTDPNLGGVARTWTNPGIPYVLRGGPVSLRQNLSINPGVIVKLLGSNSSITGQEGALFVNGTPSQPVVFTSLKDDDFGGDTNNDAAATSPAPGDWVTIGLSGNSPNSLNNAVVRYGGGSNNAMIAVNNAATMTNIEVSSSALYGMLVQNALTLTSATISANATTGGIYMINGASATLTDVSFIRNRTDGLRLDGNAKATVYNAAYTGNTGYGIFANNPNSGSLLVIATSAFTGNGGVIKLAPALNVFNMSGPVTITNSGIAGVDVLADGNVGSVARTWNNIGIPYVLRSGDVSFRQSITFAPGVIVKLQSSSIGGQEGALIAQGTSAQPIVFTSLKDDGVGGDTNNDGAATSPAPGNWNTIQLGSGNPNLWSHVAVRYGGGGGFGYMVIANNNLTAGFCEFSRSFAWGLFANAAGVNVSSSTIFGNTVGVRSFAPAAQVSYSSITGNSTFGAQGAQNAANNYWGSGTGPTVASNPGGTGDAVDASVTYTPFLTSAPPGIGP